MIQHMLIGCLLLAGGLVSVKEPVVSEKPDRIVSIMAERFTFTPSQIRIKQGALVELVIQSEDTDHGFRLDAANVNATVPPQGKGRLRVRFRAKKKGRYPFECSRPCGAGHNLMRGEVIVE